MKRRTYRRTPIPVVEHSKKTPAQRLSAAAEYLQVHDRRAYLELVALAEFYAGTDQDLREHIAIVEQEAN